MHRKPISTTPTTRDQAKRERQDESSLHLHRVFSDYQVPGTQDTRAKRRRTVDTTRETDRAGGHRFLFRGHVALGLHPAQRDVHGAPFERPLRQRYELQTEEGSFRLKKLE